MTILIERFIPGQFFRDDDVESLRRATALIYLSLINIALGLIFTTADLMRGGYIMAGVNAVTTVLMILVIVWLRRSGSVWWPAQLQIAALFISLGALNAFNGGFSKSYLMADIMLPLYTVFLLGGRVGFFWSTLIAIKVLSFWALVHNGVQFPAGQEMTNGQLIWAVYVVLFSYLITVLATLFDRLKDEAFSRLKQANEELEVARAEAVHHSLAKSEFLANMSHEIRTPLNAIIGYSEILQEDVADLGDESLCKDLDKICSSSRHLLHLINDILDLSKIEAGKMERFVEPFEFQGWFEALVSATTSLIQKNDNEFEVSTDVDVDVIRTDPTRLRQVVENLLSNAGKFTKEGKVSLRAFTEMRDESPWLIFEVQDSGIGITEEQQSILFQKFTQAEVSTSKRYGGTGLGLALCKEFCLMLEGGISVESNPGEGSLFRVEVPADLPYAEQRNFTPASLSRVEDEGQDELVLLIDDDEACHDMLQRYLSRHGYRIMSAFEGESGLELARKHHPSAILLDVCMPGLDGWDVLGELKADPEVADIPVVLVTIVDEVQKGFALGASEFMLKPFQQKELREILLRFRKAKNDFEVLVVEDDDAIRELVVRMLRKEGCTVHEACNGKEGLEVLEEVEPGLVITDLVMPELDGFSFLSAVRTDKRLATIPVVVMTAKELSQEERNTLDGSVERVLTKDAYHLQELLEALCQQMHRLLHTTDEAQ